MNLNLKKKINYYIKISKIPIYNNDMKYEKLRIYFSSEI